MAAIKNIYVHLIIVSWLKAGFTAIKHLEVKQLHDHGESSWLFYRAVGCSDPLNVAWCKSNKSLPVMIKGSGGATIFGSCSLNQSII